ncbi:MAG: hypothetical protein QM715_04630 [Nibricoccus sp.]
MNRGETAAHRELKKLAFEWARDHGFPIAACEVRIPASGYRADVAACSLAQKDGERAVALFECKQCRSDLLRDKADEAKVRAQTVEISQRLSALRTLVAEHRPDLRRGESLFPEYDDYDFRGLRHEALHGLEKEMETLQKKILNSVKFSRLRRYEAATHLYLVTEGDILAEYEVPLGWGWLARRGETLECLLKPTRLSPTSKQTERWLEAIALAGTRVSAKAFGIERQADEPPNERTP